MEVSAHLAALRGEGPVLVAAAQRSGADAPVPSCPEWVARDLVHHLGGVHRWATGIVSTARATNWDEELEVISGGFPDDTTLLAWFSDGHEALCATLEAAPADLQCWTFLPAASPRAMWTRRQLHETTVHRIDAELAATGAPGEIDPEVATDGIDELLTGFALRHHRRLVTERPMRLGIRTTDTEASWVITLGPERPTATAGLDGAVDALVEADAATAYLALWNRRPTSDLAVTGDPAPLDFLCEHLRVRWS
jgi:uncharacterized protein (TIGR03083 family)